MQLSAFAKVEICYRKAQIVSGLVNHFWLKTDTRNAGMGSGLVQGNIGDQYEGPFTKVFVIDHSDQIAEVCTESNNYDEQCLDEELEIGRSLGRFSPFNNCQTFTKKVLKKCETPEFKLLQAESLEYKMLYQDHLQKFLQNGSVKKVKRLIELEQKYGF